MTSKTDCRGRMNVLIVEDQARMRQTLHGFLQDAFPGCNVLDVADGAGALEACKACRPMLVLMDKCLPGADGIELTKRYAGIEVIVMSYRSGEIYVRRALAAGARACLVEDNPTTEFIPAVAAAIGIAPATDTGTS